MVMGVIFRHVDNSLYGHRGINRQRSDIVQRYFENFKIDIFS